MALSYLVFFLPNLAYSAKTVSAIGTKNGHFMKE